jgi:tight adherence protein B
MFFIVLLLINLLNCIFFQFKRKSDFIWIIHPFFYFLYNFLNKFIINFYKIYINNRERNKINKEIPALIDFLKSYVLAGLLLPSAIMEVQKQRKWCHAIEYSLQIISSNYAQGKSFRESLNLGIEISKIDQKQQFLCLLYLSLRLAYSTGENTASILEKVKQKTLDRLTLERKMKMVTAQMRMQSSVITSAPSFIAFVLYFVSPSYLLFFIHNSLGNLLLFIIIILNFLGAYFLHSILRIN